MKKLLLLIVMGLVGCGQTVTIPPAHVAKLSTPGGLQEGIITPGQIRLSNWCITCDNVVLLQAQDVGFKEAMPLFMPVDKMNLTVEVRGTMGLSSDQDTVEKVFSRISPVPQDDRVSVIQFATVYNTYAAPVIRSVTRAVLTEHAIMDVMANRDALGAKIAEGIKEKLKGTPLTVLRIELADLQPPEIIVRAQEKAREREIAIDQAQADKLVKLKQAEAALEVAQKQQQVDLKEAETQVLVNQKLAEGVNQAFVTQRALKIMESMAHSQNKVFFLPQEAFTNPAVLIGAMRAGAAR